MMTCRPFLSETRPVSSTLKLQRRGQGLWRELSVTTRSCMTAKLILRISMTQEVNFHVVAMFIIRFENFLGGFGIGNGTIYWYQLNKREKCCLLSDALYGFFLLNLWHLQVSHLALFLENSGQW